MTIHVNDPFTLERYIYGDGAYPHDPEHCNGSCIDHRYVMDRCECGVVNWPLASWFAQSPAEDVDVDGVWMARVHRRWPEKCEIVPN